MSAATHSEERNWGAEPARMPTIASTDRVVLSEYGRVIGRTCYRSHWLCLVRQEFGGYALLVKHGGGEERIFIGYEYRVDPIVRGLLLMDADARYLTLYAIYEARRDAVSATDSKWRIAVAEGRVERTRVRGGKRGAPRYRVTIRTGEA